MIHPYVAARLAADRHLCLEAKAKAHRNAIAAMQYSMPRRTTDRLALSAEPTQTAAESAAPAQQGSWRSVMSSDA